MDLIVPFAFDMHQDLAKLEVLYCIIEFDQ